MQRHWAQRRDDHALPGLDKQLGLATCLIGKIRSTKGMITNAPIATDGHIQKSMQHAPLMQLGPNFMFRDIAPEILQVHSGRTALRIHDKNKE